MPNWCTNRTTFAGPREELSKLRGSLSGPEGTLDFQHFMPMPAELEGIKSGGITIDGVQYRNWRSIENADGTSRDIGMSREDVAELVRKYGAADWYEWNSQNWGTKWNPGSANVSEESGGVVYDYDTAWSPPVGFLDKVAETFPQVTITNMYIDEAWNFGGVARWENGGMVMDTSAVGEDIRSISEWHDVHMGSEQELDDATAEDELFGDDEDDEDEGGE